MRLFCNGRPVDGDVLAPALVNYGHFTSLQVRGGAVQGWALHVQRLRQGTRELFDADLDAASLQCWLKRALEACEVGDASVRITVFSRAFDFRQPQQAVPIDVLIGIGVPATMPVAGRAVLPVSYQRELAHVKHVGTFPLFHYRRQAMAAGYDDALFVDAAGCISEGSTWNVAFWDGGRVIWPQATALRGVSELLLMDGLAALGQGQVHLAPHLPMLAGMSGAVACNSTGLWPLARIGEQVFEQSDLLLELLQRALGEAPWAVL